jgi:uncharacterized RDD family membrane protein YckC
MNWHYVNQGQPAGPVTEEELLALIRERKISEETLIWREGMQNWTPFHQAGIPTSPAPAQPPAFHPPAPAPLNPNEAVCGECGKFFPIDETIAYGNMRVCAGCKPVFLQKLAEGAKVNKSELDYAGFGIRLGAKLIDWLVVGVPFAVIFITLIGVIGVTGEKSGGADTLAMFLVLFMIFGGRLIYVAYEIFFLGKYGATPGKMACKLKVVSSDGSPISYGRATGRAFAEWLSRLIIYIGYLMVLFDNEQKRALHDHICNTRVVHK